MARILEAVRSKDMGNHAAAFSLPEPLLRPLSTPEAGFTESTDPVHFIEVGGADIEASPAVMGSSARHACPVLPLVPPPAPAAPIAPHTCIEVGEVAFESVPHALTAAAPPRFAPELMALHNPEHAISKEYQRLLDCLLAHAPGQQPAVFMLCGCGEQVGTTTATLNLALTLAGRGIRTAVVDACVGRPRVAARLGMTPVPGLTEVCTGQVALGRALRKCGQPNLLVLAAGDEPAKTSLAVRSVPAVLAQLRRRGDFVFVDAPPWHEGPEMANLADACDALFLVAPHAQYDTPAFGELLRRLPRQGIRLAGCVVTHRGGR